MILTARCKVTFCLWQLYGVTVQEDEIFENVPRDSLADLILKGQADDFTMKKARTALGLPGDSLAEVYSVLATLLHQYQSHWQQHDSFLYYQMQLYSVTPGGVRIEVLCCRHSD
jgi:hypothetical protein